MKFVSETSASSAEPPLTAVRMLSAACRIRAFQAAAAAGSRRSTSVMGGSFTNTTLNVARSGRRQSARFAR